MKDRAKVGFEVKGSGAPITVKCPYCEVKTTVNIIATESGCKHFEDAILYKNENGALCEIESPQDKIVFCVAIFRKNGSKNPNMMMEKTGVLEETDNGFTLRVNGKFEGFIDEEDIVSAVFDDEDDEDTDFVRGDPSG